MTISATQRDKSAEITGRAEQKYAAIRADDSLSDVARQRQIAAAYRDAKTQLDTMRVTDANNKASRLRDLHRQTFGVQGNDPLAVMSYREAVSQASTLDDPGKASWELNRALLHGDEAMARAIAQKATDHGWTTVLGDYATARPEAAQAIGEINQLSAPPDALEGLHYLAVKPSELSRVHDTQIDNLAAQA